MRTASLGACLEIRFLNRIRVAFVQLDSAELASQNLERVLALSEQRAVEVSRQCDAHLMGFGVVGDLHLGSGVAFFGGFKSFRRCADECPAAAATVLQGNDFSSNREADLVFRVKVSGPVIDTGLN